MAKIKWYGRSTSGNWKRREEADTMRDLYHKCVDNGAISFEDYDPIEKYIVERAGVNYHIFNNDVTELCDEIGGDYSEAFERLRKERNISDELTDEDYYRIIKNEDGNAFYQTFEDENGDPVEFDQKGNLL